MRRGMRLGFKVSAPGLVLGFMAKANIVELLAGAAVLVASGFMAEATAVRP